MKRIVLVVFCFTYFLSNSFCQNIYISDEGTVFACEGTVSLGNYSYGQSYSLILSTDDISNGNTVVTINNITNNIEQGQLIIYDGPNLSYPIIYNSDTSYALEISSSINNTTGSLTLEFSASGLGDIFTGQIQCSFQCQDIQAQILNTSPSAIIEENVPYINLCQNESISFQATGVFQNTSYSQSNSTSEFTWIFSDGTQLSGTNLTDINWTTPDNQGYEVRLSISDSYGCPETNNELYRIRVSGSPSFVNASVSPDTVCQGDSIILYGHLIVDSKIWGSPPLLVHSDTTQEHFDNYNAYNSIITIDAFDGQILSEIDSAFSICVNIEHSYLEDIEIEIECPSGQSAVLKNLGGGDSFLGEPIDDQLSQPGQGWDYCWTINPTYGQMSDEGNYYDTLPSGSYTSFQSLDQLVGCTLNGDWKILFSDNWSMDDGYVFETKLEFNHNLYPDYWEYQNTYNTYEWTTTGGLGGAILESDGLGNGIGVYYPELGTSSTQPFNLMVSDDYGCTYDTTFNIIVNPIFDLDISFTDNICSADAPISIYGTPQGGFFSGTGIVGEQFDPSISGAGTFPISYSYNSTCPSILDTVINVASTPTATFTMSPICEGDICYINYIGNAEYSASYSWSFPLGLIVGGSGTGPYEVQWMNQGTYTNSLTVYDGTSNCSSTYLSTINVLAAGTPNCCMPPTTEAGINDSVCGLVHNLGANPSWGLGSWSLTNGPGNIEFIDEHDPNTTVIADNYGTYTFRWIEDAGSSCVNLDDVLITFIETPTANAGSDVAACGLVDSLEGVLSVGLTGYWSSNLPGLTFGQPNNPNSLITASSYGSYDCIWIEENNGCYDSDTMSITFINTQVPEAGSPQIICGVSVELQANDNGLNGFWSGPLGTTFNPNHLNSTTYATIPPFSEGERIETYYWTQVSETCTYTDSVQITFLKIPDASAGDDFISCSPDFYLEADTVGGNYTSFWWTTAVSGVLFDNELNNATYVSIDGISPSEWDKCYSNQEFVFNVTTNQNSCIGKDTILGIFYENPVAFAGYTDSSCSLSYEFQAQKSIQCSKIEWSIAGLPSPTAQVSFTDINNPNSQVSVSQSGWYDFLLIEYNEHDSSCFSLDTTHIKFLVGPFLDIGEDVIINCGDTIQLIPDSVAEGFYNYYWTPEVNLSSSVSPNPYAFPNQNTMYYLTIIDSIGCGQSTDSVNIFVTPLVLNVDAGEDKSIACGDSVQLTVQSNVSSLLYNWYPDYSLSNGSSESPFAFPAVNTTYYVTITDNNLCSQANDSVLVSVENGNTSTSIITSNGDNVLCDGGTTLSVQETGQYEWSTSETSQSIVIGDVGTYFVTLTDQNGCWGADSIEIGYLTEIICNGPLTMCDGELRVLDAGPGMDSYEWSNGWNTQTITVTSGLYECTVTSGGCIATFMIILENHPGTVDADFSTQQNGENVEFTNLTHDVSSAHWEFGDGHSSDEISPSHIFEAIDHYDVCLSVFDMCGAQDTVCKSVFVSIASINELSKSGIKIYPNPTSENLMIELEKSKKVDISIYDLLGKQEAVEIIEIAKGKYQISLGNVAKGTYLLQIGTDKEVYSDQIIKY